MDWREPQALQKTCWWKLMEALLQPPALSVARAIPSTHCGMTFNTVIVIHKAAVDALDRIPHCSCGHVVKPDIVLYGEPLPLKYTWMHTADMLACDMVIVMGTSLSVQPFYSLLQKVRENIPRLLINREAVGPFRFCSMSCCLRDVFLQADCDDGVIQLCEELGWKDDLEAIYNSVNSISFFQETKDECTSPKEEEDKPSSTFTHSNQASEEKEENPSTVEKSNRKS